jgi:hypothetical protein
VTRFGSDVMIGAERDLVDRKLVRYTPEVVVAIPSEEARRYAREYRRAITDGSLTVRTAAEWITQNPDRTRETISPRQARLSQPVTADDPPDKDEAQDASYESRR